MLTLRFRLLIVLLTLGVCGVVRRKTHQPWTRQHTFSEEPTYRAEHMSELRQ